MSVLATCVTLMPTARIHWDPTAVCVSQPNIMAMEKAAHIHVSTMLDHYWSLTYICIILGKEEGVQLN